MTTLKILAERQPHWLGEIDVLMIANQEVHRHVERVLGVILERAIGAEDELRNPAALVVGIGPDMSAKAVIAVEAAVAQRRVRENCVQQRHDPHADAHLLHRVALVAVVEIGLHARGLLHHALPEFPLARHVRVHDVVAGFRQQLDLIDTADRLHPEAEHRRIDLTGYFDQLLYVCREFLVGAMDTVALLARQLDLPARLERDSGAIALERENMPVLVFGLEAVVSGHPPQQVFDPARAGVGDCGTVGGADDDFFVLGTDAPLRPRLAARLEVADQVVLLFKQLTHASIRSRLPEKRVGQARL